MNPFVRAAASRDPEPARTGRWVLRAFACALVALILIGVIIGFIPSAYAQSADTVLPSEHPTSLEAGFDHVLSIYEWRGHFDHADAPVARTGILDSLWITGHSRSLTENALTSTEASGCFTASLPLDAGARAGSLRALMQLFGTTYRTAGGPTTARTVTGQQEAYAVLGLESLIPGSPVSVSAAAGFTAQSQRLTTTEQALDASGTILQITTTVPRTAISEQTDLSGSLRGDERFYRERDQRFSNDALHLRASSLLPAATLFVRDSATSAPGLNTAALDLTLGRRDYFFWPDTFAATSVPARQERVEYAALLMDTLVYPITDRTLTAETSIALEPHTIERTLSQSTGASLSSIVGASSLLAPSEVSSLRLAGAAVLRYASERRDWDAGGNLSIDGHLRYEEQSQTVRLRADELPGADPAALSKLATTLEQASFDARSTTLGIELRQATSATDVLHASMSSRLLNYDTPSLLNDDDHDELFLLADAGYRHAFDDRLTTELTLRASQAHLVYLKSTRSAQNSVTRSLSLAPSSLFVSRAFAARVGGEVFANYTVLDYLGTIPGLETVGDHVVRGAAMSDSIEVRLTASDAASTSLLPRRLVHTLMARLSERGAYDPGAFSERRDALITEVSGALLLGADLSVAGMRVALDAGVRGFYLDQSGRTTSGLGAPFELLTRQVRVGPALQVSLWRAASALGAAPVLSGSLWYATLRSETLAPVAALTRSPQIEGHLVGRWAF